MANKWNVCSAFSAAHSQKTPIFGIQLHFLMLPQCSCIQGFYLVAMKGLDIIETNGGKVAIGPIAILAIGEVRDQSHTKKSDFLRLQMSVSHAIFSSLCLKVISLDMRTCLAPPIRKKCALTRDFS